MIGIPNAHYGEEVAAVVRPEPGTAITEDEVREFCRANISPFMVPQYVRFVQDFPMTASGKVKKFELRAHIVRALVGSKAGGPTGS